MAALTIVAQTRPFVIGVDCHARTHTYAIIEASTKRRVACEQFPTTSAGISRALAWVGRRTDGEMACLWAVEGIGSYGAHLAKAVADAGYDVAEAPRMNARGRRAIGKSDPLDAAAIGTAVLALEETQLRAPRRAEGTRAGLRILSAARDQLTRDRTVNVNALVALLRAHDLGFDARKPLVPSQIATITRWRERKEQIELSIAREEAVRLARRVLEVTTQLTANQKRMTELIQQSPAAPLLEMVGAGAVTVATVLTAWSHPGRVRSEAAFASLAGVNPLPASSANTVRHRLNRGGDRRLNRALHTIIMTRMVHDPGTRDYVTKRTQEGRSYREIRRSLKRYIARTLYRQLNVLYATAEPAPSQAGGRALTGIGA
ncbi:IS110 family transposase [Pseudarthrobacter polychromogenes]|uniref:IS110 family transposase n=1 Tax=Pseudarthrobacter polychromogenes TaxID=1676 RepID=A0ABQ1XZI8_9MICC|nr:IS110 family transposase [Pseudarthrobacter polychromogenes]